MNSTISRLTVIAALLAGGTTVSRAQTATTGAFQGFVSDTTGAPLAGALKR